MTKFLQKHAAPIFFILYAVIIYFIASMPPELFVLWFNQSTSEATALTNTIFITSHIIVAGIGIYLFYPTLKKDFEWIIHHFGKYILYVLAGFLVLILAAMFVSSGTSQNQDNLNAMQASMKGMQLYIFYLVLTIIGPLNEEFVFRQIFIGRLSTYIPKWVLWIISGILFGLLHIPSFIYLNQIWPYLIDGLVLGFVYIKTDNNMLASLSIHLLNNLLSLLL